jgi:hypothetical protein
MIDRTKKLPARFYISQTGRNPVREWILELPSDDRHTEGHPEGRIRLANWTSTLCPAWAWLVEVRSNLDNNRIARVIFCMGDGHMVLLHGFVKKTQKTPQQDIELAQKRKREVT